MTLQRIADSRTVFQNQVFWAWVFLVTLPSFGIVSAEDWPQILGPNRDGVASNEVLLPSWPAKGPTVAWEKRCGEGFAGVAVKGDQVILFHRLGTEDLVENLDARNGKQIWINRSPSTYRGGVSGDLGPRCVPLIYREAVLVYGSAGDLRKLKLEDGSQEWKRQLVNEFDANEGYFGAGSAPLIVGDTVIVIVGGRKGGIVGLNLKSGETRWATERVMASYAAPISVKVNDRNLVACVTKLQVVIVDPTSGEIVFQDDYGKRGPTVNAAMPLVVGDQLFLSSSYAIGARLFSLKGFKTTWENNSSLSSQYTTAVVNGNYLYGTDGREDFGDGSLRCVDANSGAVKWEESGFGLAHLIRVREEALAWKIDGTLVRLKLTPERFMQKSAVKVFDQNAKSLPALSNGRLFVKANGDVEPGKLKCLIVGKQKPDRE